MRVRGQLRVWLGGGVGGTVLVGAELSKWPARVLLLERSERRELCYWSYDGRTRMD
jgi:hypothetical protein